MQRDGPALGGGLERLAHKFERAIFIEVFVDKPRVRLARHPRGGITRAVKESLPNLTRSESCNVEGFQHVTGIGQFQSITCYHKSVRLSNAEHSRGAAHR